MGNHQHAVVLSFYFLLRYIPDKWENNKEEFFKKALKETINLGGDTDTNACIVGGMVGALVGLKYIP